MPFKAVSVQCVAICAKSRKLCSMTAVHGEPHAANAGTGWTVDDSEFGARLALVRQRMKWNIKEAAVECGVPAASWASWEAGSMPRRYSEICGKIADRTGADYFWLMAGSSRRLSDNQKSLKQISESVPQAVEPSVAGHPSSRPFGSSRRDSTRPESVVAANKRRPTSARPGNRPMSA